MCCSIAPVEALFSTPKALVAFREGLYPDERDSSSKKCFVRRDFRFWKDREQSKHGNAKLRNASRNWMPAE